MGLGMELQVPQLVSISLMPLPAFCSSAGAPLLLLEGAHRWAKSASAFPAGSDEGCWEGDAGESEPF